MQKLDAPRARRKACFSDLSAELVEHVLTFCEDSVDVVHAVAALHDSDDRLPLLLHSDSLERFLMDPAHLRSAEASALGCWRAEIDERKANASPQYFERLCMEVCGRFDLRRALSALDHNVVMSSPHDTRDVHERLFSPEEMAAVASSLYFHGGTYGSRAGQANLKRCFFTLPPCGARPGPRVLFATEAEHGYFYAMRVFALVPSEDAPPRCEQLLAMRYSDPDWQSDEFEGYAESCSLATAVRLCSALGIEQRSGRLGQVVQLLLLVMTGEDTAWNALEHMHAQPNAQEFAMELALGPEGTRPASHGSAVRAFPNIRGQVTPMPTMRPPPLRVVECIDKLAASGCIGQASSVLGVSLDLLAGHVLGHHEHSPSSSLLLHPSHWPRQQ